MYNQLTEDYHLFSEVKKGSKKAYDVLFRKYYPILCAYCHRFVELEDAEEIVQDVMLWLWESKETLQIESSLGQYLFKAVYHRSMNRIAQNQSQNRANTLFYLNMQEMLQDTNFYQFEELKKRIKAAIDALPQSYRESFMMHRFQNMSYKEIASILGISSKTVDYRIQQALKLLRIELKDYLPSLFYILILNPAFYNRLLL